ncbi:MAG: UDP-glucose/GDP-mannose dehydrogenase family protein, partial [Candidatus Dormibacteraeota bacterium]|nr:UDP-glucose/GDP-mannose dehydrogenase family protein [Candidatus Dormibacteraeota bacterium]
MQPPSPICVVGAGYVGLVTAVCLADAGVEVRLLDIDEERLAKLAQGRAPIHEPLLDDLLQRVLAEGLLSLHRLAAPAIKGANVVMIAVGTPPLADGRADLGQVRSALQTAVSNADPDAVVVLKSTVPPGTTVLLKPLSRHNGRSFPLVVCPEFLSEGSAVKDFRQPPQVVVGGDDEEACVRVSALFGHLDSPVRITDSTSAELIKYGVNAFLALKISFINEMAQMCEATGADVEAVADGVGADPRIGRAFLGAGLGFGGSCFPKDVLALDQTASYHGQSFRTLRAAVEVNAQQRARFVAKVQGALRGKVSGKRIAVLGLAFKPGTDDLRQAASIDVIRHLEDLGANVVATDPVAVSVAQRVLPLTQLELDVYECIRGADAIVIVTEWPEYRDLDWTKVARLVRRRIVIDGRNCLDGDLLVR